MIGKILLRIFREHLLLHLIIPLAVGLIFNVITTHFLEHHNWKQIWFDLRSLNNLVFAGGVSITYLVIMYRQVKKETSVTILGNDLAVLEEELSTATRYFATGAIGLKEWFDPVSQVYLSSILRKKLTEKNFKDERTLLFANTSQMEALTFHYLDGYYAERLVDVHVNVHTPLAFLRPKEVRQLLLQLNRNTWKVIRAYPRWCRPLPAWMFKKPPFSWVLRLAMRRLDFAFITHANNSHSVLLVRKEGEHLRVRRIRDDESIKHYCEFVKLIRETIYKPGTEEVNAEHDFVKFYHPVAQ